MRRRRKCSNDRELLDGPDGWLWSVENSLTRARAAMGLGCARLDVVSLSCLALALHDDVCGATLARVSNTLSFLFVFLLPARHT